MVASMFGAVSPPNTTQYHRIRVDISYKTSILPAKDLLILEGQGDSNETGPQQNQSLISIEHQNGLIPRAPPVAHQGNHVFTVPPPVAPLSISALPGTPLPQTPNHPFVSPMNHETSSQLQQSATPTSHPSTPNHTPLSQNHSSNESPIHLPNTPIIQPSTPTHQQPTTPTLINGATSNPSNQPSTLHLLSQSEQVTSTLRSESPRNGDIGTLHNASPAIPSPVFPLANMRQPSRPMTAPISQVLADGPLSRNTLSDPSNLQHYGSPAHIAAHVQHPINNQIMNNQMISLAHQHMNQHEFPAQSPDFQRTQGIGGHNSIDFLHGKLSHGLIGFGQHAGFAMGNNLGTFPSMTGPLSLSNNIPYTHRAQKSFHCRVCDQVFENKSELMLHSQNVHKQDPKPYKCTTCHKCFANSSYLSQHARIHAGVKPYRCQICERRFTQLCHLQQHIRTHTGEKPYKCQYDGCGKAFSQLSNLQSHSRAHMTDRPYRCNSCYKCFADEAGLREHIPKHSDTKHLKTHICHICGKSYTQETYLARHMSKHGLTSDPLMESRRPSLMLGDGSGMSQMPSALSMHGMMNLMRQQQQPCLDVKFEIENACQKVIGKNEVVDMSGNSNSIQNFISSPLTSQQYPNTTCAGYIYNHISPSTPSSGGIPNSASNRFFPYEAPVPNVSLAQPILRRSDSSFATSNLNHMETSPPTIRRSSFSSGGSMTAANTSIGGVTNSLTMPNNAAPQNTSDNLLSLQQIKNFATAHPDYNHRE